MDQLEFDKLVIEFQSGRLSRDQLLRRGLALGLSLSSLGGVLAASANAKISSSKKVSLTVLDWGPPYSSALQKYVVTPFDSANGTSVTFEEQAKASDSLAKIQAQK